MCHITLNKIAIFGDNGAITPGGVRIGKCRSHLIEVCNFLTLDEGGLGYYNDFSC